MADTRPLSISRRTLIAAAILAAPAKALAARSRASGGPVVTILGDSITAGLGLPAQAALPAQLHLALEKLGVRNQVRGAGVSGDTSGDGAARVDFSIQPDTRLVVVALGGNDLLQGVDPRTTKANLDRILTRLKQRRIAVVLAGVRAPSQFGAGYARDFDALFANLARTHRVTLYPDLLAGVARNPALNQGDAIHPNAQGVKIIAARLAPVVARELAKRP
jgi:acyl-CoA thioesterase-1